MIITSASQYGLSTVHILMMDTSSNQGDYGVQFFERLLDLPNDPEAFAQTAPQCPVSRLDFSDARDAKVLWDL